MLTIDQLAPFQAAVADKKEIRFMRMPNGTTVACYMFMDSHTFDSAQALECRGIAFDETGSHVVSRPLHKFFNLGEKAHLTAEAILAREDIAAIYEKIDGSMIATAWVDGQMEWRSKKAFDSGVVQLAKKLLETPAQAGVLAFAQTVASQGLTAIFELTHPEARIVVATGQPQLRLLHVRDNHTGAYVLLDPQHFVHALMAKHGVPRRHCFAHGPEAKVALPPLLATLPTIENIEGYVVQFADGDMVKIKCAWYQRMHRAVTFLRERDIARLVLAEQLDDVKSVLNELGIALSEVEAVESRLRDILVGHQEAIDALVAQGQGMDRKTFAVTFKHHPLFGLAIQVYLGNEIDLMTWYEKNHLRNDFSLRVLGDEALAEALEG